jgi:MFS transporter, NRE family, putaive nickel resistance protein
LIAFVAIPHSTKVVGAWWRGLLADLPYGARILLAEPALRLAIVLSFAEAMAGAAAIVVTVVYVRDWLLRGDSTFGLVMAALGVGSSITALLLGRWTGSYERGYRSPGDLHARRHRWAEGTLLAGGCLLALALLPGIFVPPLFVFGALWVVNGAGQTMIAVPSMTLLAEHVSEQERGRAYAAHFALTHAFWLLTYPLVGHAAARWGAPATFTAAGIICLATTGAALLLSRRTQS